MITVKQLISFLQESEDTPLRIKLPDGEVPVHFHITEIGRVDKTFVDCGGTVRVVNYCSMQVWVANDVDHRITANKLLGMIKKSNELVPIARYVDGDDLPVMIEYGQDVVALYELQDVLVDLLYIEPKKTECLAPELCGLEVLGNNCCGEDGCC